MFGANILLTRRRVLRVLLLDYDRSEQPEQNASRLLDGDLEEGPGLTDTYSDNMTREDTAVFHSPHLNRVTP